jgi:hypothetical protein
MTSGFLVPYRMQSFDKVGRLVFHWNIEQIEINGKVDPDLFRPPKR